MPQLFSYVTAIISCQKSSDYNTEKIKNTIKDSNSLQTNGDYYIYYYSNEEKELFVASDEVKFCRNYFNATLNLIPVLDQY